MIHQPPVDHWRKSSYSGGQTNCLEIGSDAGGAAVRDSKDRAAGYLSATGPQWAAFLAAVKAGRYDG